MRRNAGFENPVDKHSNPQVKNIMFLLGPTAGMRCIALFTPFGGLFRISILGCFFWLFLMPLFIIFSMDFCMHFVWIIVILLLFSFMVSLEKLAEVTHFIKEIENALPVSRGPPPPSDNV